MYQAIWCIEVYICARCLPPTEPESSLPFGQWEVIDPEACVSGPSEETAFPFLLRLPSLQTEGPVTALGHALRSMLVLQSLTFLFPLVEV